MTTLSDLRRCPAAAIVGAVPAQHAQRAKWLVAAAWGRDATPVEPEGAPSLVGTQTSFPPCAVRCRHRRRGEALLPPPRGLRARAGGFHCRADHHTVRRAHRPASGPLFTARSGSEGAPAARPLCGTSLRLNAPPSHAPPPALVAATPCVGSASSFGGGPASRRSRRRARSPRLPRWRPPRGLARLRAAFWQAKHFSRGWRQEHRGGAQPDRSLRRPAALLSNAARMRTPCGVMRAALAHGAATRQRGRRSRPPRGPCSHACDEPWRGAVSDAISPSWASPRPHSRASGAAPPASEDAPRAPPRPRSAAGSTLAATDADAVIFRRTSAAATTPMSPGTARTVPAPPDVCATGDTAGPAATSHPLPSQSAGPPTNHSSRITACRQTRVDDVCSIPLPRGAVWVR